MLQALSWAALGTGFTFLMTTLGAAVVFFFVEEPRPQFQRTMLGFAAGVMTAASVWSLLLPAIEQSADFGVPGWLPAAAGLLLGVGFLSALDAVLPHLRRAKDMDLTRRQSTLLMAAITLHNVPEGMAVGLAFALAAEGEGMAGAAALALGIGIQNLPEGAAISLPLRQEGSSRGRAFLLGDPLRQRGADFRYSGSAGSRRCPSLDAMAPQLRRRSHAVCGGRGVGTSGPFQSRDLRLCGGLFNYDGLRRGAGIVCQNVNLHCLPKKSLL